MSVTEDNESLVILEDYFLKHPDRQVTITRNTMHSETDKRLRVTIEELRRPYRPKLLGTFVVETVDEALNLPVVPLQPNTNTGEPK